MALTREEAMRLARVLRDRELQNDQVQRSNRTPRKRKPKLAVVQVYPEHPEFAEWRSKIVQEYVAKDSALRNISHAYYYARFLRGLWLSYGLGVPPQHCTCRECDRECVCDLRYRDPDFFGLAREVASANLAADMDEKLNAARAVKRVRLVCAGGARVQA
jgi:hypothetical protein